MFQAPLVFAYLFVGLQYWKMNSMHCECLTWTVNLVIPSSPDTVLSINLLAHIFEVESYESQAGLWLAKDEPECPVFLLLPPKYWDNSHVLPYLVHVV